MMDRARRSWTWWASFAGLPVLVAANVYLRRSLEHADQYLYSFLSFWYPDGVKTVLSSYPIWKLLLPIKEFDGSWSATTLLLTHLVELRWGPAHTWYLFNALLIVASFATSWVAFRSRVFSYTFALCMGFGTQLYHAYAVPGAIASPLLFVYYECLLLCAYAALTSHTRAGWWMTGFAVSALWTALGYESWLDMLVFTWVAAPVVAVVLWRAGARDRARRAIWMTLALTSLGALYVLIKTNYGYAQQAGSESDVVFNYGAWAPAVEDVFSNTLTHLYIAATNYLPPSFLSSTALYELGGERLIESQHGYHAPFSYLVPMHYLFLWRYWAGAVGVIWVYAVARSAKAAWRTSSPEALAVLLFLLMMGVGGPTHALVKFRPMKSVPIVGYHAMVGVLGVSLLIAYGLMLARRRWPARRSAVLVTASWVLVLYGSLARPAMLSHLAAQSGLGEGLYPDPLRAAALKMGVRVAAPGGAEAFRLQPWRVRPRENAIGTVGEGDTWLPELATPLPDWGLWQPTPGVAVSAGQAGSRVRGDASRWGYQLTSPAMVVNPRQDVRLRLRIKVDQGRVCAGVLESSEQRWLLAPAEFRQEYRFNTAETTRVRVVIANCNYRVTENDPSMFTVYAGSYEILH